MIIRRDNMDIIASLTSELNVGRGQVEAAVKLIDEGNTIPFIARYRKEATGSLNDEVLRTLDERLRYLRGLEEKKAQVMASIADQGKLTGELKKKIGEARTMVAVDDLYLPYRPKRKTRASMARERGLEPLADWIASQNAGTSLEDAAKPYVSEEKGVDSVKTAIAGAKDIWPSGSLRMRIPHLGPGDHHERGRIASEVHGEEDPESVYEKYFHHEEPAKSCPGHRVLALNRGEKEKILTVKVEAPEEKILQYLETHVITGKDPVTSPVLKEVVKDSYGRLMAPAIEREIRNAVTEKAENGAFQVFKKTLNQLLMEPPISGQVVLGWDPAFRTGCKLAVVDPTGKVLDTVVIYPTAPQNKVEQAKKVLKDLIGKYHVTLISLGNGTASRESEQIIADFLKEIPEDVRYVIVNEAGASVYSASKLATEEFPGFDVGQRSAVSIARRLQDPLAELVKIDPKSIGVGQYQHDLNQKRLDECWAVVEDCVNRVGVDLNLRPCPC
ncbi:MAG: Tex-like N-terminal domain-containing protein [Enterocloster sp.]